MKLKILGYHWDNQFLLTNTHTPGKLKATGWISIKYLCDIESTIGLGHGACGDNKSTGTGKTNSDGDNSHSWLVTSVSTRVAYSLT